MKFTRSAILGLALSGWLSGCTETDTTISVNVRYFIDALDPSTFKLKIEQEGQSTIESDFVPRELDTPQQIIIPDTGGDTMGYDYDVVCQDNWNPNYKYCRFFKRFEVPSWSASETKVTLSGKTLDGQSLKDAVKNEDDTVKEELTETFELEENEVNVVYFELDGLTAPGEEPPPPPPEDAGSDAGEAEDATAPVESDSSAPVESDSSAPVESDSSAPVDGDASSVSSVDDAGDAATMDAGDAQ